MIGAFEDMTVDFAKKANELNAATSEVTFITTNPDELAPIVSLMEKVEPVMVGMGLALLSLVMMLEFYNIAQQQQMHQGIPGIEIMFGVLLKFICGLLVVRYGMDLAGGMYAVGNSIADWIMSALSVSADIESGMDMIDIEALEDSELTGSDFWVYLVLMGAAFLQILVVAAVSVGRLFKGVLLISFAPLALVAFFGTETKQMGVGFIRNMLALAIQGAIIVFVIALFPEFIRAIGDITFTGLSGNLAGALMNIVLAITMITSITKSSTIAKELVGA